VVEDPHLWPSLDRPGDERFGQIQTDLALSCDALLMGRHTYDVYANAWPGRNGDFADRMNSRSASSKPQVPTMRRTS
jgi:dihydrofolate reductase